MTESFHVDIPKRSLFKAGEVCELVKLQPYVLRSWEAEFPNLGISKSAGAPRVYRRADVVQVVRIKHLLLVEGLTLAGARRRLEEEAAPVGADAPAIDELIGRNARERLTEVKRGLRSILDLLSGQQNAKDFRLSAPTAGTHKPGGAKATRGRAKPPSAKSPSRAKSARRRRSA